MSLHLSLECLTDVAITAQSATVGGHRTLGVIPGAHLLGAVAGDLYQRRAGRDVWDLFHSGAVRYGTGLPLGRDGDPALPVPLCWHVPKEVLEDGARAPASVANFARATPAAGVQFKQLRDRFVDSFGWIKPPLGRTSMRTAVGPGGRARDGLLYEIAAIPGGTKLAARIDADEDRLLEIVAKSLLGRKIRVGRSRTAEYGVVEVQEAAAWPEPVSAPGSDARRVLIWCLSDLCVRSAETGQPSHLPSATTFGLPADWSLDGSSYLRFRRYSPFNTHRKRPDLERHVIVAGSVLCFTGESAYDVAVIEAAATRAVGEYRSDGLGRFVFEPMLLRDPRPEFAPLSGFAAGDSSALAPPIDPPDDELARWMIHRAEIERRRDDAWKIAASWCRELDDGWAPLPPAQWGNVRRIARSCASTGGAALLTEIEKLVTARTRNLEHRWGALRNDRDDGERLSEALLRLIGAAEPQDRAAITELAATHIVRLQRGARP